MAGISQVDAILKTPYKIHVTKQYNKIKEYAKTTFDNLTHGIIKVSKYTWQWTKSHKLVLLEKSITLSFIAVIAASQPIALTLGVIGASITTSAIIAFRASTEQQFKASAKEFIHSLENLMKHYKNGCVSTNDLDAGYAATRYIRAKFKLEKILKNNMQSESRLLQWKQYLKNINPNLRIQKPKEIAGLFSDNIFENFKRVGISRFIDSFCFNVFAEYRKKYNEKITKLAKSIIAELTSNKNIDKDIETALICSHKNKLKKIKTEFIPILGLTSQNIKENVFSKIKELLPPELKPSIFKTKVLPMATKIVVSIAIYKFFKYIGL